MSAPQAETTPTPEVVVKKGPELEVKAQEPVAQPVTTPVQAEPKKGGMGCFAKFMIIGCLGLLLCCCVTVVLSFAARSVILPTAMNYIAAGNQGPDKDLTRVGSEEVEKYLDQAENKSGEMNEDGTLKVQYSEEEFVASLLSAFNATDKPLAIGVDFEESYMKVQFDIGVIMASMQEADTTAEEQADFSGLEGYYATLEFTTNEDGSKLIFENFSLGNTVLDPFINSMLTQENKDSISKSIQESMGARSEDGSGSIKSIKFLKDAIEIVLYGGEEGSSTTDVSLDLSNCLDEAQTTYMNEWNDACLDLGEPEECRLSTTQADLLDQRLEDYKNDCYELYNR
jgi:hypothetical protein